MISLTNDYLNKTVSHLSRKTTGTPLLLVTFGLLIAAAGAAMIGICAKIDWTQGFGFDFKATHTMLACAGLALFLSGVAMALPAARRGGVEWLLGVPATIAVVIASGLVRWKFGDPTPDKPFLMMVLVGGALLLPRISARLSADSEKTSGLDVGKLLKGLWISAEFYLLLLVIKKFNLVSSLFCHQYINLIFYGFIFHYLLPRKYRLSFFFILSMGGLCGVFGVRDAAWLAGIGIMLICICHLPLPFLARVAVLTAAGIALTLCRGGYMHYPWNDVIWPILGSMFMFRLIAYMHALKHHKGKVGAWQTLSYFFLIPNVVFPLFPVVDYTTFCKTYYNDERHRIYQTGIRWILRGIIHLILYRFVYYYVVIGPEDVNSGASLFRYMVSNFLLILRLSGQFHLIVGILLLFGFNLPETMNRYWLASSFTDFWRRANIYWKDFMQKVVFYPLFFRLRKMPPALGLGIATLFVFLVTWFLHAYQWFWLRGSFSISLPDVMFWGIFGVLVVTNTLHEAKHGRKRELGKRAWPVSETLSLGFRIAGTFTIICILWSLWISMSVSEWLSLWPGAHLNWSDAGKFAALFAAAVVVTGYLGRLDASRAAGAAKLVPKQNSAPQSFFKSAAGTGLSVFLLFLCGQSAVYSHFGFGIGETVHDLRTDRLSKQDMKLLHRGYYENLTRVNRFNSQLWEVYSKRKDDWGKMGDTEAVERTPDFLGGALRPWAAIIFKGESFHTNRWGMRDRDYEKVPAPGTCRIAVLGGSISMGSGVPDGTAFESVLEERLNLDKGGTHSKYEVLNFSVAGYMAVQRLMSLEQSALPFKPDIVLYVGHPTDIEKTVYNLATRTTRNVPIPYERLRQIVHEAGVENEKQVPAAESRLQKYGNDITAFVLQRVVKVCRENHALPVYVFVPLMIDDPVESEEIATELRLAKEAGFIVIDLSGAYDGGKREELMISSWDSHPNAKGHRMLGERLYEEIQKNPELREKLRN